MNSGKAADNKPKDQTAADAPVYAGMSQAELDAQYTQATLVPDLAPYQAIWQEGCDIVRSTLPCRLDIRYGPHPRQVVDLFPAGAGAPALIHLHGGAWLRQTKQQANFMAAAYAPRGVNFIAADFAQADDVTLGDMVDQVRALISWVYGQAGALGVDRDRLYLSGHSSGGHLGAMVLASGWRGAAGLPEDVIKAAMLVSGVYDLEPVRLSARNDYLRLDEADAARLSPIRHIPKNGPPLMVAWGDGDLDEFRRQSRSFADHWARTGNSVEFTELKSKNHFDMNNMLAETDGPLMRWMSARLGLE